MPNNQPREIRRLDPQGRSRGHFARSGILSRVWLGLIQVVEDPLHVKIAVGNSGAQDMQDFNNLAGSCGYVGREHPDRPRVQLQVFGSRDQNATAVI